jgi:predicted negative regulator of RcsB-dependent stress response
MKKNLILLVVLIVFSIGVYASWKYYEEFLSVQSEENATTQNVTNTSSNLSVKPNSDTAIDVIYQALIKNWEQ